MPVFAEATTIYVEMNDTKLAIGQAKQAAGLTPANDEKPPEVTLSASTDGDRWPHARPPRKNDTAEDERNNISYPTWGSICNCGNGSSCKASHTVVGNGLNTSTIKFTSTTPCDHFIFVACGNSRKVIRVVFYQVDVNVNNTCGMHEISPGALILFNCDWDCTRHYTAGSEAPEPGMYPTPATLLRSGIDKVEGEIVWDYEYADSCNNENDLKSVTISIKPNTMTGKFTVNYGDDDITLWEAYRKNQVMPQMPTMPGQPERPWPPYENLKNSAHDTGVVPSGREYDLAKLGSNSLSLYAEGLKVGSSMILVTFAGSVKSNAADAVANSSIVHVNGADGATVNSVEMVARQAGRKAIYFSDNVIMFFVDNVSTGYNYDWAPGHGDDYSTLPNKDTVKPLNQSSIQITYSAEPSSPTSVQLLAKEGNEKKTYSTSVRIDCQNEYSLNKSECCGNLTLTLPLRVALNEYVGPKTLLENKTFAERNAALGSFGAPYISGINFVNPTPDEVTFFAHPLIAGIASPAPGEPFQRVQYGIGNWYGVTLLRAPDPYINNFRVCGIAVANECFDEEKMSDSAIACVIQHEVRHCKQYNNATSLSSSLHYKIASHIEDWETIVTIFEAETNFEDMRITDWYLMSKTITKAFTYYKNAQKVIITNDEGRQALNRFMVNIYQNCPFTEYKRRDYNDYIDLDHLVTD